MNNDWIEWKGGECPLDDVMTLVEVKLHNGRTQKGRAGNFAWQRFAWQRVGIPPDIIAYRLHETDSQRIDRLERELKELKAERQEPVGENDMWEPKCEVSVYANSWLPLKEEYIYKAIFPASIAAEYVHEHAPDWDGSDPYTVWYDSDNQCYGTIDAYDPDIGTVTGPKWVMQKLADDLNSGRVEL